MRRLVLLFFMFSAFHGNSQQNRFTFFQGAANEPFYIRMEDKTFSSNSFGSLVLSKLKDSTYTLYIGLPRNKSSEEVFNVPISGSDRGLELKKASDGSIRLYDWQKMIFIEPSVRKVQTSEAPTQAKTDNYSKLMAAVVDDPAVAMVTIAAIEQQPVQLSADKVVASTKQPNQPIDSGGNSIAGIVKEEEKRQETNKLDTVRPVKNDVSPAADEASTTPVAPLPVIVQGSSEASKPAKDSSRIESLQQIDSSHSNSGLTPNDSASSQVEMIITLSDTSKEGYRELVIVDKHKFSSDTIDIRIPLETETPKSADTALYRVKENNSDSGSTTTTVQLINSDCTKFATDTDVDKVRVSILNANSNDSKVAEAKKVFRTRCFSTKQIRALSELFSSDDGRYKLFDAAYPFVSDSGNFKTLITLLEDSFYINRFKTLARIQD